MGDVKRYTMDENSLMGGMDMFEDDNGEYVLHSDYDTILARHNALVEAVAWERKRADRLERAMASVLEVTEGHVGSGPLNVIASIAVNVLEGQYDD